MNNEKYLPLGTVVLLKGGKKRLMITGFLIAPNDDKTKVFDYCGVIYPEGMITSDKTALFNHEQIDKVDFLGFIDEEEKNFKAKLDELAKTKFSKENSSENSEDEMPIMQGMKDLGFDVDTDTETDSGIETFNI